MVTPGQAESIAQYFFKNSSTIHSSIRLPLYSRESHLFLVFLLAEPLEINGDFKGTQDWEFFWLRFLALR